ncbi:MAG: pyridoxamine 5'-phosphate oxidase family protein [Bacillota bacterium]|nr:pyridoxamine 5'-phosphate oxidase family protein [Bacillota bacterium]
MTKQEILDIINKNPVFYLATVEDTQPRVRGMLLYKADEDGIVFHTGSMRDLYGQILKNPKAELCFNDFKSGVQVRVRGILEVVDDIKIKDEISEHPTRTFLNPWKESISKDEFYRTFIVLKLKECIASTWTMENNFAPKEDIKL